MTSPSIFLREADKVEITILVDNYSDILLPDTDNAVRLRTPPPAAPLAEHGLACLVSVYSGSEKHTILMDVGISGTCLNHNAALLAESIGAAMGRVNHRIDDVETLVLSHGHFDHFCGLPAYLAAADRKPPCVAHPQAISKRRIKLGEDAYFNLPTLDAASLEEKGVTIDFRAEPSTLAQDLMLLAGQVERITPFEKGAPNLEAFIDDAWVLDPFPDDQAIAINLKDKGLVVLGGCSHAGIVNTVEHLRKVSKIDTVHAVLGGFHLSGAPDEVLNPTVEAIKELSPRCVVPMHCTGWSAINAFADKMPDAFVLNSVGTTYIF
jgi:7,8-dihydropterin-6-yl-methyl-4-(beta-D-ribofuranosyl)aminobenzene 5'-phosphate synthase